MHYLTKLTRVFMDEANTIFLNNKAFKTKIIIHNEYDETNLIGYQSKTIFYLRTCILGGWPRALSHGISHIPISIFFILKHLYIEAGE